MGVLKWYVMDTLETKIAEVVSYFRRLGFFQNPTDYGVVNAIDSGALGSRYDPNAPVFPRALTNLPVPAHASMTDDEIAQFVFKEMRKRSGGESDLQRPDFDRECLRYDPFRILEMDRETMSPGGSCYGEILRGLARISCGAFMPNDISEWWEDHDLGIGYGPVHVYLVFNGREYEIPLNGMGDWADDALLLGGVNELLSRSGSPYRFYYCYNDGQIIDLVALTPEEKMKLEVERGWKFPRDMRGFELGTAESSNLVTHE